MSSRLLVILSAVAVAISALPNSGMKRAEDASPLRSLESMDPGDIPVDITCMTKYCESAFMTCKLYEKCSKAVGCLVETCLENFENDSTPMKSKTQSCLGMCLFSYADFYYTGFGRCLTDNKCLTLPYVATTCRYQRGVSAKRKFQTSDLRGGWWKVRGYNPAYDCIACQHTFFDGFDWTNDSFVYRPTFEALAVNGSFIFVNGTISVNLDNTKTPGDPIQIDYYLYGMPIHQTWYVLDGSADNSTILVYYCGNVMSQWNFEGAMILSRSPILKPTDDQFFAGMVQDNTDLDYSKFCHPQIQPCPN